MKPYYSIEELACILHDPIYVIADGLAACGVSPVYEGKPADLSSWANLRPTNMGENGIVIVTGEYPVPDPSYVIVSSEVLPQLWKDCIKGTDSGTGGCSEKTEKSFAQAERDSMLKLVVGMAVAGYKYDPNLKKNSAVADIEADLAKLGLPLTDDTIRKYIKEGIEYLPKKRINT